MRASAREQLDMLGVFHRSTTTLGAVLEGVEVPLHERPAPPDVDLKSALLNLGVLALRTARAGGVLIRSGYELEANGLLRRIREAHARGGGHHREVADSQDHQGHGDDLRFNRRR